MRLFVFASVLGLAALSFGSEKGPGAAPLVDAGDEVSAQPIQAAQERDAIVGLVYLTVNGDCGAWPASAERATLSLAAKEIEGPWVLWTFKTYNVGTIAGFLNSRKYGNANPPCLLALNREGKVQAAYGEIQNRLHLQQILKDLAAGRGTKADIERRLNSNPADTQALWELAKFQMACPALGSFEITHKRIAQLDPDRRTPAGEQEFFLRALMSYFGSESFSFLKPTAGLGDLRDTIRSFQHRQVRCEANDRLATAYMPLGDGELIRSLFLEAWKDRDPEDCGVLAIRIRECLLWPDGELAELEPAWREIDAVATAAQH